MSHKCTAQEWVSDSDRIYTQGLELLVSGSPLSWISLHSSSTFDFPDLIKMGHAPMSLHSPTCQLLPRICPIFSSLQYYKTYFLNSGQSFHYYWSCRRIGPVSGYQSHQKWNSGLWNRDTDCFCYFFFFFSTFSFFFSFIFFFIAEINFEEHSLSEDFIVVFLVFSSLFYEISSFSFSWT